MSDLIMQEIHELKAAIQSISAAQQAIKAQSESVSARAWDYATKLGVAATLGIATWVFTIDAKAKRNEYEISYINRTRINLFTKENAAEMEARILAKETGMISSILSEFRVLSNNVSERLVRLETTVNSSLSNKADK